MWSGKRRCFCRWNDCEDYRNQILDKAPTDHLWRSDFVRLLFADKNSGKFPKKKLSWEVSVRRHLLDNDTQYYIPLQIYIYPHHFPLALLDWRKQNPSIKWNTPIILKEAQKIDNNDFGNRRFVEYTNSFFFLLSKSTYDKEKLLKMCTEDTKQKFHQSPMTTRNEITSFINDFTRFRKARSKEENIIDVDTCLDEQQN